MDTITSRKSKVTGSVSSTRSLTGTAQLVQGGAEILLNKYNKLGNEDGQIPVGCLDPATCASGFTVSAIIKVIGSSQVLSNNIFLFGNRISEQHRGWSVGVRDRRLEIFVSTNEYVCSFTGQFVMANVWFYLAFKWNDPARNGSLEVYIDEGRYTSGQAVSCDSHTAVRSLQRVMKIGTSGSTAVKYDNLAIWYKLKRSSTIRNVWKHIVGKPASYSYSKSAHLGPPQTKDLVADY